MAVVRCRLGGWARLGATAMAAVVGAGCASERARESATMAVDTVAGVVHVRHSGDAAPWRLREMASIGSAEGPAAFGRVRSVVADGEGNVFIADNQTSQIHVFSESGEHLRTFGRTGAGPGEYTDIYSLAWMGDSLAVFDPRAGRISLLSATGEWLGQIPHPPVTGPEMRLHSVGRDVYSLDVTAGPDGQPTRYYLRYAGGGRIDTLPYPVQRVGGPTSTILCRPAGGGLTFFTNPYAARPLQSPAPGKRVALASSAAYHIAVLGPARDTAFVIEKAYTPVPITDAEWEKATQAHREWSAKNPGVKCAPVEFTRPAGKTAIRAIFFDDAERMWVEVTTAAGHSFDVFDSSGAHLGSMASPGRQASVPPYVRGDRMYLVSTDSLDVQSVKVLGIER